MGKFGDFGNKLYTGEKSIDFIGRRKIWYLISAIFIIIAIIGPVLRGGFNAGIEFTGGNQFQVHNVAAEKRDTRTAESVVERVIANAKPRVTQVGQSDIGVQTEPLKDEQAFGLKKELAAAYGVDEANVTTSFIGAVWGQDITRQALVGLGIFLLAAALFMAIYFRTWKMSLAAIVALFHDLIITAGLYGITGFEVTPAAMIGFLTILGYSLYDTVVVFDKIRENTTPEQMEGRRTFVAAVNLAVNQTLVRSINTSVVALLPVAGILFIGAFLLGAGTLRDISLALFIGIFAGAYSTIFIAAPFYAQLRADEQKIKEQDAHTLAHLAQEEQA